jgi:excinuclease UvrABC nuclease subunit
VSKKRQYVDQVMRPAIYVLYQGAEVVYVGQSSNVFSRLATHKKEAKKEFDSFRILYCRHNRMTYWERRLIKKYEPKYNISQNRRKAKELGYKTPAQRRKELGEW